MVSVYKCGSSDKWSPLFSFRTANDSSNWSPIVAVYGDMGVVNAQILPSIQEAVEHHKFDTIIHLGDFAYDMKDVSSHSCRHFITISAI